MTAAKLVPAIKRIAERATKDDELAILALLELCERKHRALEEMLNGTIGARVDAETVSAAGRDAGLKP